MKKESKLAAEVGNFFRQVTRERGAMRYNSRNEAGNPNPGNEKLWIQEEVTRDSARGYVK